MVMYKDSGNKSRQLKGGQPFVLYWQEGGTTSCFPFSLPDEGKDMIPGDEVSRDDVVQFKFDIDEQRDVKPENVEGKSLLYRVGSDARWKQPMVQRRRDADGHFTHFLCGEEAFLRTDAEETIPGHAVRRLDDFEGMFQLLLEADDPGIGKWVSAEKKDGSIQVTQFGGAQLFAVRHGDAFDDALGETQTFSKRTWDDLANSN
ncbi:hypothetical protein [Streptomyces sp. NBC_01022]|uniref:hypothetical protein n=1 Tax=Streptomyces sp. NBC_01022 TaxID=2903723 RepID=UPI002DD83B6E|nr:hypothetical protein [Streptomyces sp. NBC_01022]WRZ79524.1 hypothetical protein OG316_04210 [Streptomyces sp. NBC_01022]